MRIPLNKKIIVSVISDVVTDQRVQKECYTLYNIGYDILVIGRKSKNNFLLEEFPYKVIRFHNLFRRGPFMYLVFNLQLFFYLLFKRADILWSNDLDTLLPNFIISKLKRIKLVYDSHEYFPFTVYKKSSRLIWQLLESFLFPRLKNVITVNSNIKNLYEEKYGVPIIVLRNVPLKNIQHEQIELPEFHRNKKILVIQGIGINEHRGAEEAVAMMKYLPDEFILYFLGGGTVIENVKQLTVVLDLSDRVFFMGILPYRVMMGYTKRGFFGLVLEKVDFNDAHRFSLSNRFFDYIKANIPVLCTHIPDMKIIIEKYNIGGFIDTVEPRVIADRIIEASANMDLYNTWKRNTIIASQDLCWENEEKNLISFMQKIR
jgi:glycosyltransferase involved in cell wall biosynthesis